MAPRRVTRLGHVALAGLVLALADLAAAQPARLGVVTLIVAVEMTCPSCAAGLERRLARLDDVASVEVKPEEGQVIVTPVPNGSLDVPAVRDVVRNAGFEPTALSLTAVGRVTAMGGAPALALAGESVIRLAPGDATEALVAAANGRDVRVTGGVVAPSRDGTPVLHVETFEIQ